MVTTQADAIVEKIAHERTRVPTLRGSEGKSNNRASLLDALAGCVTETGGNVGVRDDREQKCSREDSNLHGLPHTVLSRTRLPIPPRELKAEVNCSSHLQAQLQSLTGRAAFSARVVLEHALFALRLTTAKDRHSSKQQSRI